jgi:hypothetical protein
MDKKIAGLLGAVGALTSLNSGASRSRLGPDRTFEGSIIRRPVKSYTKCFSHPQGG